jgi:hypothetical protein
MIAWSERIYAVLTRGYPARFRSQFGSELRLVFRELARQPAHQGALGRVRLWQFVLSDLIPSIARERAAELPWRTVPARRVVKPSDRVPYGDALLASLVVFALYIATLAPTVAFWDAGEYLTAAHVLGIPHQPGNPLFVLLAHGWEKVWSIFPLSPAIRLNLFSAFLSAAAHFFWFLIAYRVSQRLFSDLPLQRLAACVAVLLSATTFTVWNQSNVNEKVYTLSLFTVALVSWLVMRWRDTHRSSWLLGAVFVTALTATNHLMGVLVAPAVLLFVFLVHRAVLLKPRFLAGAVACYAIGLLPQFFLPLRSAQRPVLNEGEPTCASVVQAAASIYTWGKTGCPELSGSLRREQYGKPSISLDPTVYPDALAPRSARLLAAQIANYAQYFNWQWARSIGGADPLVGGARPLITLVFLLLGIAGAHAHWRRDRASAAYVTALFVTLSLGLVVYLNFKYGFAQALGPFPDPTMHEVRERDYFFLISFSVWALWSGLGLVYVWQALAQRLRQHIVWSQLATAPVLALAVLPASLNWQWASRANDYTARDWAYNVLMSVEPYGVLFTNGDNDTFPLWYLQEVEGLRRDVTVMVASYLNTPWYARQVRDLTRPCAADQNPSTEPSRIICQRSFQPNQYALPVSMVNAPKDSILPLSDEEIDQIAAGAYVLRSPVTLQVGGLRSTVPAGTQILPADTFVAAIVKASIGQRPIHFVTPAPTVEKFGWSGYTVRRGLTIRLHESPAQAGYLAMPQNQMAAVNGAYIDVDTTTQLLERVFQQRGRVLDASAPWVDQATTNILLQYAWLHYGLAQANSLLGRDDMARRQAAQAEWWQRRATE